MNFFYNLKFIWATIVEKYKFKKLLEHVAFVIGRLLVFYASFGLSLQYEMNLNFFYLYFYSLKINYT